MEYTHKFSSGAVRMEKMLDEYHTLRKTRGYCQRCPNYNKYWSCPEFAFDESILLKEFKFMYIIGREYQIPKKDRQKVIGIKACGDYCTEVNNVMKVESWKNLIELEKDAPGVLTLMPGNCHVCDLSGEGCARPLGKKCRHPELMRFSLESLGFDVDAICKFEIGLLLQWPREGHLPEKLSAVMAIMTNEKLPMELLHKHFPDVKRHYLKAGETILGGEDKPKAKRVESWLDKQAEELMEIETDPEYERKQNWIGFKSEALDSGDYVKARPWAEGDDEYPDPPQEAPVEEAPPVEMAPPAATPEPIEGPEAQNQGEDDDALKYKWLGFKRSAEEAEEKMLSRPIPKFSISEEEKAAQEAVEAAETAETAPSGHDVNPGEAAQVEKALEKMEGEIKAQKAVDTPSSEVAPGDKRARMRAEFQRALKAEMAGMSEEEAAAFLAGKLGIPVEEVLGDTPSPAPQSVETAAAPPVASAPPASERPPRPAPKPKPEPEPIEFLDAAKVDDVLGAALRIAKAVALEVDEPKVKEAPVEERVPVMAEEPPQPETPAPHNTAPSAPSPEAEEEDDSKYKWLGFKGSIDEEKDASESKGWKKAY